MTRECVASRTQDTACLFGKCFEKTLPFRSYWLPLPSTKSRPGNDGPHSHTHTILERFQKHYLQSWWKANRRKGAEQTKGSWDGRDQERTEDSNNIVTETDSKHLLGVTRQRKGKDFSYYNQHFQGICYKIEPKNGVAGRGKEKVNKQIMQEIGENHKRIKRPEMCSNRLVKQVTAHDIVELRTFSTSKVQWNK